MGGYEIVWLGVQRSNIIPYLSLFTSILFFFAMFLVYLSQGSYVATFISVILFILQHLCYQWSFLFFESWGGGVLYLGGRSY